MNNFLTNYQMKIQALSPIHIGDGRKINKKEYINLVPEHKVLIPDPVKIYLALCQRGLEKEHTEYLLNGHSFLNQWLRQHSIQKKDYHQWILYEMDSGDIFSNSSAPRSATPKEIMAFTKDPYHMPYVPGSSIKGMLRTALLAYEFNRNPGKYENIKELIKRNARQSKKGEYCLAEETNRLETAIFHTLNHDKKDSKNAVNSNLSGLIVSDSQPIPRESLTLSQKIDYKLDGTEAPLPILRETLKPGTNIYFNISIDKDFPYTIQDILNALNEFQQYVYKYFYSRFHRGSDEDGIVWLGGGCGFLSKTILYPIFKDDAVQITDNIFNKTLGSKYRDHKHTKDISLRLAPHVCKCTHYNGRLYDMGMGKIQLL